MMSNFIFLGMLGPQELFLILIIVILLFGARKIPDLMRGLGKGIKEFKDASKGIDPDAPPPAGTQINEKN